MCIALVIALALVVMYGCYMTGKYFKVCDDAFELDEEIVKLKKENESLNLNYDVAMNNYKECFKEMGVWQLKYAGNVEFEKKYNALANSYNELFGEYDAIMDSIEEKKNHRREVKKRYRERKRMMKMEANKESK